MSEDLTMYENAGSVFPRIYEEIKALLQKELKGYCRLLIKNNPEMERVLLSYLLEQDGVKDSSINIDIGILSHLFSTAINEGIIDANPCQKVKRLKVTQVKDRVLSGDEISAILDMPEGKDRLMILAALFTGMRLNEVLNLSWDDIVTDEWNFKVSTPPKMSSAVLPSTFRTSVVHSVIRGPRRLCSASNGNRGNSWLIRKILEENVVFPILMNYDTKTWNWRALKWW